MARNVNPTDSPTAKAMDRAIHLAIQGNSPYPEHAAFVDADSPHAGQEISRALDEGYAVMLVSAHGRERGNHREDAGGESLTVTGRAPR
jgi:hypothetical protein